VRMVGAGEVVMGRILRRCGAARARESGSPFEGAGFGGSR